MGAMVTVHVTAQVEADVQRLANEVFKRAGLTLDQAVQEMLERTAQDGTLPFAAADATYKDDPAYDAWFRAKVQEALDDPRPYVSNAEAKLRWANRRAELLSQAEAGERCE